MQFIHGDKVPILEEVSVVAEVGDPRVYAPVDTGVGTPYSNHESSGRHD